MDLTVLTYLIYLGITIPLTVWVARALSRYGEAFLNDTFGGDVTVAHAVNQLLVIGFYLLNLGYVALFLTSHATVDTARRLFEVLSTKVGAVAIVVGLVHFANLWAFSAFRRRAELRANAVPPVQPSDYPPVATPAHNAPPGPPPSGPGWIPPAARTR